MAEELNNLTSIGPTDSSPLGVGSDGPSDSIAMPGQVKIEQAPEDEQTMRLDIERSLADVSSQNNSLETKKFIAKNKIKNFKITMLRDIYSMLQKLGVDPSNPDSIKNFLTSLAEQDPDMLTLFETIFDVMSPDNKSAIDDFSVVPENNDASGNQAGGKNLMDKYSNLQEQILR